jgi:hypothetical protein
MSQADTSSTLFPTASEDVNVTSRAEGTPQTLTHSHRLAFADTEFLLREELRAVRLQLELMKPELIQQDLGILSTVVIFGSTRIPDPETARDQLASAREAAARNPGDPKLAQAVGIAERLVDKSRYRHII